MAYGFQDSRNPVAPPRYTDTGNSSLQATGFRMPDVNNWIRSWGINDSVIREAAQQVDLNTPIRNLGIDFNQPIRDLGIDLNTPARNYFRSVGWMSPQNSVPAIDYASSARAQAQVVGQGRPPTRTRDPYFDTTSEIGDVVQDQWQRQYDDYISKMQAEENVIKAGAQAGIEAAEDQLGDLRAAAAAVGLPFDEYIKARQSIGGAIDDAPELSASMRPVVSRIYDSKQGEMKQVLKQIDMNFGPKVAAQINGSIDDFENVIQDVIRTDESAIDLLHDKKGQYAKAMAQAAYSNDVYAALDAETKINAQLDKGIEEAAEDLARQKRARDAAIAAAKEQIAANYEWTEPDVATVTAESWNEYFEANGIPQHERAAAMAIYETLKADPANTFDEQAWRRGITEHMNLGILATMGYTADSVQQRINESKDTQLLHLLNNRDLGKMFQNGETKALQGMLIGAGFTEAQAQGIVNTGLRNADKYQTMSSPEVKHLKNMRNIENDVTANWDTYIAEWGPQVDEADVYRAPNGYVMPVAGGAKYSHDWGNPRSGGRTHEGIDLFAPKGTPVLSPVDGVVDRIDEGELGGLYVKIKDSSGRIHYLAHLSGYARNLKDGMRVRAGMMVGMVGNTGNARTTPPHLHYGIYGSGGAIDPYHAVHNAMQGKNPTYAAGTSQSISNYQGKEKKYTYRL